MSAFNSNLTNEEKENLRNIIYRKIPQRRDLWTLSNPFYNFRVNELRNNIYDIYEDMKELEVTKKKVLLEDTKKTSQIIKAKIESSKIKNDIDENGIEFNKKFNRMYHLNFIND